MSVRIACQTITFGEDRHKNDIEGIFKAVSEAGYTGIEIGSKRLELDRVNEYRELMSKYSLEMAALHMGTGFKDAEATANTKATFEKAVAIAKALGCKNIFTSGGGPKEVENYFAIAGKQLNELGKSARADGIRLSYHNHARELEDNGFGMYTLAENSDPENLSFVPDIGWIVRGNYDPVEYVKKAFDRIYHVHFKEFDAEGVITEIGKGVVNFKAVYDMVKDKPGIWIVAEQDRTAIGAEASVKHNLLAIKKMGE